MPLRRFVQEEPCPHCGKKHTVSIDDNDLPCQYLESSEDDLFIAAEAESIELKNSAFNKQNA